MKRLYVWTLPTRLFHWLFVALIVGGWVSVQEDRWLSVHVAIGSALVVLVLFRIVWGIMGPKYSRFGDFSLSLSGLKEYLFSILNPSRHYIGHNPAASFVVIAMLSSVLLAVLTGMLAYGIQENRGVLAFLHPEYYSSMKVFKEVHEFFVNLLWALIAVHVGGVLIDRLLHKDDRTLPSIIDGYKNGEGDSVVLSDFQKIAAIIGIGGTIGLLVYVLSVPSNPLIAAHNPKVNYERDNPIFVRECGSCHTLYPPTLLAKEGWQALMSDLSNHFGDDASLDLVDEQSIREYLVNHSAETSTQEMSVKMMQSLEKRDMIAITQTPFWKQRHRYISDETFKSDSVKSRANCKACHSDVEQGTIEDSAIKAL